MSLIFRVETVAEIDSTNEELKRRALLGAEAGLVLRAGLQTAGRGRRGRNWVSEPGNLYVSLTLEAPEFGPRRIYANLGRAAGQDTPDVYALLWNPAD